MRIRLAWLVVPIVLAWYAPADGQIGIHGVIAGTVQVTDGAYAPGATVTLTGAPLIQRSVVQVTNGQGQFRFYNLNPGEYVVTVELSGFETTKIDATVNVGKTTTVQATLTVGKVAEQVVVEGQASVVDRTSAQISANFTSRDLAVLPNSRDFMEVMEVSPGVNDRTAFAAGGNVEGYDTFGWGAATNSYQVNGVSVNNLQFGNTWVNPNYDTIAEIQLVGPGASAEYSNFTGASVNVVTKAGTNEYRGGGSIWYSDHNFLGDNSGGIPDYWPDIAKYNAEVSGHLGGPIVKERLLFFGSVGYFGSSTAPHDDPTAPPGTPRFYDHLRRKTYQARADFLANDQHRLTGMYDGEPILDKNLGLKPGSGPEIGYFRDWTTNTEFIQWQAVWNSRTLSEIKYAAVSGHQYRVPNAPLDVSGVTDLRAGSRQYNSMGFRRDQENSRHQIVGAVTRYVDDFLGANHEFKVGADYEYATSNTDFTTSGNAMFYLFPYSPGVSYLQAIVGYNQHIAVGLKRFGSYVQDKITLNPRTTLTLGLRYDSSSSLDRNTDKEILGFSNPALRVGFAYDATGDGRTVIRAAYGRYYEKVPMYGPGTYAGTGQEPISYYALITDQPVDPTNTEQLAALIIRPENLTRRFETGAIDVDPDMKNPRVDAINLGFEKELPRNVTLSLSYLYKRPTDFISLATYGDLTFEPFTYTHPFNGQQLQLYNWTNPEVPRDDHLANLDYWRQRNHMTITEVRTRFHPRVTANMSLAWERSTGTRENNECGALGLCTNLVDKDPNHVGNPFRDGVLLSNREWQFKVNGSLLLPWDVSASWDYRWLSGHPWGASAYSFTIPGFNGLSFYEVRLEPKDANRQDPLNLMNLRLGKEFRFGRVSASGMLDILNVFNNDASRETYYNTNINGFYTYTLDENGHPKKNFGKPYALGRPREFRVGLRLTF